MPIQLVSLALAPDGRTFDIGLVVDNQRCSFSATRSDDGYIVGYNFDDDLDAIIRHRPHIAKRLIALLSTVFDRQQIDLPVEL